jgi:multidrug efflux pump subunit AcrB
MLKWMDKKSAVAGAVAVVIAGGALIPNFVLAQTPTETAPTTEATAAATDGDGGFGFGEHAYGGRGHRGGLFGDAAEEVATALGVTVEDLQAAAQAVREALKPAERPTTLPTEEERAARQAEFQAALAAELGVSPDALATAIEAAKPTDEEIAAKQAERLASLQERLATAVDDGRLTQAQADQILTQVESGERPEGLEGFGRPGFGGRGHFGQFGPHADGTGTTESSGDAA